jgi:hypothetical protein
LFNPAMIIAAGEPLTGDARRPGTALNQDFERKNDHYLLQLAAPETCAPDGRAD